MIVDIQFSPAVNDWPELRDAVLKAEAEGYTTTWVFDHFDGAMLGGDRPMLECFTLLGALAEATASSGSGTIGLGTLVANVVNRHPAHLALAASTVQRISGGRLILGLGAGSAPGTKWATEHGDRGIALQPVLADRHAAVIEQMRVVREAFAVPLILGVNSVELARTAGRLADGINVRMAHPRAAEFVSAACEEAAGRPFDISGWAFTTDETANDRAAELGLDRLIMVEMGKL
ncbi:MAG: LLM class flavin-dependent oxidoreductase [Ilumatobacteraceae bacterium]